MSCGPLNGLLTSSIGGSVNGPSLQASFNNSFQIKFSTITLECSNNMAFQSGILNSSLACENFVMPFGTDTTNTTHGYNLQAELSSSLQSCISPWFTWVLT